MGKSEKMERIEKVERVNKSHTTINQKEIIQKE